ncbi:hypothetical protein EVAR_84552_1 [Eumeta japonica]|uniref:Histone-lysine N-methyltransferase SETMAR n=1 Tax=Eumeta variegata TaxID=151549 RepID=A0A4C1UJ43_EUMVA|nr:hypothetical protein EVAR_84552_1 [Eumeta japonica]
MVFEGSESVIEWYIMKIDISDSKAIVHPGEQRSARSRTEPPAQFALHRVQTSNVAPLPALDSPRSPSTGLIKAIKLKGQKTVTPAWYTQNYLSEVLQTFRIRGLKLHHNNASSHTAALTIKFLKENDIIILEYPPYSSDLTIGIEIEKDEDQNPEPEPGPKLKTELKYGLGIRIESLFEIKTQKMKELFAFNFIQIRTAIGSGIRIESGTDNRIENGIRITIESGTEIENGLKLKTSVESKSESKYDWDRN